MRICKRIMEDSNRLFRLAEILNLVGMPTQTTIARGANVHQSLVSRAKRGLLKRLTPKVGELCDYAESRAAQIERFRAERQERRERRPALAEDVLSDCRRYLDEGCDPVVLRDQLNVLRRAQGQRARLPRAQSATAPDAA